MIRLVVCELLRLPGRHRALVPEDTAALGERLGELRRLDDNRQPGEPLRYAKPAPKSPPHPGRGDG